MLARPLTGCCPATPWLALTSRRPAPDQPFAGNGRSCLMVRAPEGANRVLIGPTGVSGVRKFRVPAGEVRGRRRGSKVQRAAGGLSQPTRVKGEGVE